MTTHVSLGAIRFLILKRDEGILIAHFGAFGDANLCFHDIDASDLLGHGVLDLNARVDFDEVILAGVDVVQVFDGASVRITSPLGPINAIPAAAQASAKSGFSERKP